MPTRKRPWPVFAVALLLGALALPACGGDDSKPDAADGQTVTFQKPTDKGPDPFTEPADVRGSKKVNVGSGPYGGTGSDLVCDRELLIRSLRARPERLREWARVLDVEPDITAVARYIRGLRAVTLTRDTRVTNHSFVNGRAVAFQSILQAGTAVLVDKDGVPVVRCRCGNPLLEPIYVKTAKCFGCPANYRPPPDCVYVDFARLYRDYNGDEYLRVYRRSDYDNACYLPYPEPPKVKRKRRARASPATTTTNPAASFSPSVGTAADTYTLSASGFRPNVTLSVRLTRPDGAGESYSITTNSSGSGSYTFPRVADAIPGTYTATVRDPGSGDSATATVTVRAETQAPEENIPQDDIPEQQAPDPNYDCPDQPPAHPGEDYLRNCPNTP